MSASPTLASNRNDTLRQFQRDVGRLLSEQDRDYLHDILKDFHTYNSVESLVASLKSCLDTPKKLDLLVDIRNLLPSSYRTKFDAIAPYNQMSKPFRPPSQNFPIRKAQSSNSLKGTNFHVVNIQRSSPDSSLGLSIRGGEEYGTGVFISKVDENSSASKQGLRAGDQVIECSGTNFEDITHTKAVQLLSSMVKVKLVVKSEGRVPEYNEMKSGISWVDGNGVPVKESSNSSNGSDQTSSDHHSLEYHPNSTLLNSIDEKRINFTIHIKQNGFIGFNLRGGKEYGVGIYVSKVDHGSVPHQAGLQVGDLILDVNGTSFEGILHQDAVDWIKSQEHIMMTIKSVGILPAAKLFYSDVSWIYPDGTAVSASNDGKNKEMLSLSLPEAGLQELLRQDSSTQVNILADNTSSPSHSDMAIQADIPWEKASNKSKNEQTLSLPEAGFQELRRDSSTQVNLLSDTTPSPAHSDKAIQANNDRPAFTSTPTQTSETQPLLIKDTSSQQKIQQDGAQCVDSNLYEAVQPISPFLISESTKTAKLKGGDDDSTWSGNDRSSNGSTDDNLSRHTDQEDGTSGDKQRKVKKSKSFLQKQGDKIKAKLSFRKKGQGKPKVRKKGDKELLSFVDERCKTMLVAEDYDNVISQIKKYKDHDQDIERLVNNLLITLDTPRKAILLRDIRAIVVQYDLGRYDAMISNIEVEALEFYGKEAPVSPDVDNTTAKPKKTLVEAVQDSRGNFLLRTRTEAQLIKQQREELKKERLALKCQGSSILEREAQRIVETGNEVNGFPDWERSRFDTLGRSIQVMDSSTDLPGSSTFGVHTSGDTGPDLPAVEVSDTSFSNHVNGDYGFLTVPDRLAVEYNYNNNDDDESQAKDYFTFDLPKIRTSVGISISGGAGSRAQPEIRIEKVFPGGAAADDGTLQSGWELISIDDESLQCVSHAEAVDIIRRAYNDKSKNVMRIVCVKS